MKKYCTRCGRQFESVGREVICAECRAHAAEDAKRAAVLKAKRASWTGESVPVRISGRASTVIRRYGAEKSLPFAQALDELLKASDYFKGTGKAWIDITPYKSRRRDKAAADKQAAEFLHDKQAAAGKQDAPQDAPQAAQAAKVNKASTTAKKTASKAAAGKGGKA